MSHSVSLKKIHQLFPQYENLHEQIDACLNKNDIFEKGDDLDIVRKAAYEVANPSSLQLFIDIGYPEHGDIPSIKGNEFLVLVADYFEEKNIDVNVSGSPKVIKALLGIKDDIKEYVNLKHDINHISINWDKLKTESIEKWNNKEFVLQQLENDNFKPDLVSTELWNDYDFLKKIIEVDFKSIPDFVLKNKMTFHIITDRVNQIDLKNTGAHGSEDFYFVSLFYNSFLNITYLNSTEVSEYTELIHDFVNEPNHLKILLHFFPKIYKSNSLEKLYFFLNEDNQQDYAIVEKIFEQNNSLDTYLSSTYKKINPKFFTHRHNNILLLNSRYVGNSLDSAFYPFLNEISSDKHNFIQNITPFLTSRSSKEIFNYIFQQASKDILNDDNIIKFLMPYQPDILSYINSSKQEKYLNLYVQNFIGRLAWNDSFFKLTDETSIEKVLSDHPTVIFDKKDFPPEWKTNPKYIFAIMSNLSSDYEWKKIPNKYWTLIEDRIEELIKTNPRAYQYLPSKYEGNSDLLLTYVHYKDKNQPLFIPNKFWNNKDFCLNAISAYQNKYEEAMKSIPTQFWNDKLFFDEFLKKIDDTTIPVSVIDCLPYEIKAVLKDFNLTIGNFYSSFNSFYMNDQLESSLSITTHSVSRNKI